MKRLSIIFALLSIVILIFGCSNPDANTDLPSGEQEIHSTVQTFFSGDTVGKLLENFADATDADTSGILSSAYATLNSEEMYFYIPDNGSEILGYHLAVLLKTDIDGKVDETVKPAIALFCSFTYNDSVFDSVWISSDDYDQGDISFADGYIDALVIEEKEVSLFGYSMGDSSYISAIASVCDDDIVYFLPNTFPYTIKGSKLPGIDLPKDDEFFLTITDDFLSVTKTGLQSLV